ncbi:hypothetical protein ACTFIW_000905 [Dictyostelium discoideum]
MSTTVNNNDASSSSTSASNNAESFDLRMKSMKDQINNLSLAFTRFMKEPMFSSNTNSRSQRTHDDSDTESEQGDDESSNNVDVPTDYQLSDTLLGQYKHMVNNQGLLVEEECILKKDEISELNKVFNFPSNFQVNVAPFGTPEGITVSSTVKNNDTDLLIVEKRINDSLKPLLLMSRHTCELVSSNDVNSKIDKTPFLCSLVLITGHLIESGVIIRPLNDHFTKFYDLAKPDILQSTSFLFRSAVKHLRLVALMDYLTHPQELQLATEERSVQSNPTSVRSNSDGSVRISSEPSNEKLLNNQNECTPH